LVQEPGVAEKEFSPANARYIVRQILCNRFTSEAAGGAKPAAAAADEEPLPPWLTEADVDRFASEFERTGFTGGINYYRNMDRNWELAAPWADAKVAVPTRFVVGDGDLTYHYPGIQDYIRLQGRRAAAGGRCRHPRRPQLHPAGEGRRGQPPHLRLHLKVLMDRQLGRSVACWN